MLLAYITEIVRMDFWDTVPGAYKYGELALEVGGISRIGTIKYGLESRGTALARASSYSKLQIHPLVREGATI
jgi:hypothetical protein